MSNFLGDNMDTVDNPTRDRKVIIIIFDILPTYQSIDESLKD